jgi:hypothetical protein
MGTWLPLHPRGRSSWTLALPLRKMLRMGLVMVRARLRLGAAVREMLHVDRGRRVAAHCAISEPS